MSLQMYKGTVKFELGEVREGDFGPYRGIAISMDDPNAPNTKDGTMRMYRDPTHKDIPFLETLGRGERVTLAYQPGTKDKKGYYTFLVDYDETFAEPAKAAETVAGNTVVANTVVHNEKPVAYPANAKLVVPLSTESTLSFIQVYTDRVNLLMQAHKITQERAAAYEVAPTKEVPDLLARMTSTAFIQTMRDWNPAMLLADGLGEDDGIAF